MNTNKIKSFAREARVNLLSAVEQQIRYWGFETDGKVKEAPEAVVGGYIFRGTPYDDATVIPKWNRLKARINHSTDGFSDVAEEAAYTWFNRLVAIKILEENGFIDAVITWQEGTTLPAILQNAKAGHHEVTDKKQATNLKEALINNDDEKAFGILITHYCNQHPLLKEVFGKIDDYTELLIPQNLLSANGFLSLLHSEDYIEKEDYGQVELIGWLYQFYISDKKDEVFAGFKKNRKARAEDIPAATQIFTPKWIVSYMVENTLGKVYLDFEEGSDLKDEMKYLVKNEGEEGSQSLIEDITELTLIDPACGSGHILVTGFEWLYRMYREQGYSARQAVESILKNNLFGLDIDDRAMQLARFAVLLKAALQLREVSPGQGRELLHNPILPHIYSFPESRDFITEEIAAFTGNQKVAEISKAIGLLRQGKNIGSALKLELSDGAREVLKTSYASWKEKEQSGNLDLEQQSIWEYLKEYVEVALTLSGKYTAVVANPPYMVSGNMNSDLLTYCKLKYPMTCVDLSSVFLEVTFNLAIEKGFFTLINQSSWAFKHSGMKFRKFIVNNYSISSFLDLGAKSFDEISGEVVQSVCSINFKNVSSNSGNFYDLRKGRNAREKEMLFMKHKNRAFKFHVGSIKSLPNLMIGYSLSERAIEIFKKSASLTSLSEVKKGIATGNDNYFLRLWFEVDHDAINFTEPIDTIVKKWIPIQKGGGFRRWAGNTEYVVNWYNDGEQIKNYKNAAGKLRSRPQNLQYSFKEGITYNIISSSRFIGRYLSSGFMMTDVSPSIFGPNQFATLALLNSHVGDYFFRFLCPGYKMETGNVGTFPILEKSLSENVRATTIGYDNVINSKRDWDSRETSWNFERNLLISQNKSSLKEAYYELVNEVTKDFFQLHENEEELNRIFIDIYGLQEELTPDVPLKDITILQDELKPNDLEALEQSFRAKGKGAIQLPIQTDVVMAQLMSYLIGVLLGRYRLDKEGLHIAHPKPTDDELKAYPVNNVALPFTMQIDEDAIIPLMGSGGAFADDVVKKIEFLVHHIWGDDSLTENLNFINECLGMPMEKWLTEKFWPWHISGTMYKKKPIYWLFCSNPKRPHLAVFRVLVYMHRMDAYTVQTIMRRYLHPHQEHLRSQYERLHADEASLTKTEQRRMEELQKQIVELQDYAEKLKSFANKQITVDLDDGVTVNYAKFEGVVAEI